MKKSNEQNELYNEMNVKYNNQIADLTLNITTLTTEINILKSKLEDVRSRTKDYYNGVITYAIEDGDNITYKGYNLTGIIKTHYLESTVTIPPEAYDKQTSETNPFSGKWYLADNPSKLRTYIINDGNGSYE